MPLSGYDVPKECIIENNGSQPGNEPITLANSSMVKDFLSKDGWLSIGSGGAFLTRHEPIIYNYNANQIWGVSTDGRQVEQLTESIGYFGYTPMIPIYFPDDPRQPIRSVEYFWYLNAAPITPVQLPTECFPIPAIGTSLGDPELLPCKFFSFSPDGHYLAMMYGPQQCGRGMIILNIAKNEIVYQRAQGVHGVWFIGNEQALISTGHCQGGGINVFDLNAKQNTRYLADEGRWYYSPTQKAAVVQGMTMGDITTIYAFNTINYQTFMTDTGMIANILWVPDGDYFLYQKSGTFDNVTGFIPGPAQIMINSIGGAHRPILSDSHYNYHLCDGAISHENGGACGWHGDWIAVRKSPYASTQTETIQSETLGLNWRTGQTIPWDQVPAFKPTPTPTATPVLPPPDAPNLSQPPIYVHPSGRYGFYTGTSGRTLWMVPQQGKPVLWVIDGEHFIYIP